jgi:nicotinate-nucleotide adenylyltransferase
MEVALLGGSFNPPHIGHLMAALYVRSVFAVDQVWLLPSFHHPLGKALVPFEDRVALCEALGADLGAWFHVSRAESEVGGEGRTIQLLEYLLPRHPATRFRFVIGSDIVAELPKWQAWDRVQALVEVTVLNRAGFPAAEAVGPPLAAVSSSAIRRALEAGVRVDELVPRPVLECARRRGLYGASG